MTNAQPQEVTREQVVQALRDIWEECGRDNINTAVRLQVNAVDLMHVIIGVKEPTDEICAALGFRRRVVYERVEQ